jgi:hypothetical protein
MRAASVGKRHRGQLRERIHGLPCGAAWRRAAARGSVVEDRGRELVGGDDAQEVVDQPG